MLYVEKAGQLYKVDLIRSRQDCLVLTPTNNGVSKMYPEGNTATPQSQTAISPSDAALPTEEDMGKVRAFIDQAINAFVNASQLKGEVEELRTMVAGMRDQMEKVRRQNDWLDEQLVRIRGERDQAINMASNAKSDLDAELGRNSDLQRQLDLAKTELGKDTDLITQLKRERDDAQYTALQLEEELAKVRAKVEKFLSLADEIDPPEVRLRDDDRPQYQPAIQEPFTKPEGQQVPITQSWDAPKPAEPKPWVGSASDDEVNHPDWNNPVR